MAEAVISFTRHDLVSYLEGGFGGQETLDRGVALEVLEANDAPPELLALFADRVPEGARIAGVRALWGYFGDLPVDRRDG